MPAYRTPAEECVSGSKLREVAGSVCENCYALKGNYKRFARNIKPVQYKRLEALENPRWVDEMVLMIERTAKETPFFRWHHIGDLQSVDHFRNIVAVAVRLPEIRFWLPTREYGFVREYLASDGVIPSNLVVRLSAYKVDGPVPEIQSLRVSSVFKAKSPVGTRERPSRFQDNECRDWRAC